MKVQIRGCNPVGVLNHSGSNPNLNILPLDISGYVEIEIPIRIDPTGVWSPFGTGIEILLCRVSHSQGPLVIPKAGRDASIMSRPDIRGISPSYFKVNIPRKSGGS